MKPRAAALLLLTAASACAPAVAPEAVAPEEPPPPAPLVVTRVTLDVRREPGSAFCEFSADGKVRGGHLSGDDPPFVHQEDGALSDEARAAVWKAAEEVLRADLPPRTVAGDRVSVRIEAQGRPAVEHAWPFGEEPADPRLAALSRLLHEHHVGGW